MTIWLAPMMGYTHGWFRSMIQAIHPGVRVMSEMITLQTLKHCPNHASLWCHPLEEAPALQIAGSSVRLVEEVMLQLSSLPFSHINLNAGCPSAQVGQGCMGAAMMYHPELTRDVLVALQASGKHISIKTRLGVDALGDDYWDAWLKIVLESEVREVFLHARIALLNGLNPAQNRQVPPLRYDRALEIAALHPEITWTLNGGLNTFESIQKHRAETVLSGVMLGRIAYQDPMVFWRLAQVEGVADYSRIERWLDTVEEGVLCHRKITSLLALTKGLKNSKKIREVIANSKGKKYQTGPLRDLLYDKLFLSETDGNN